MYASLTIKNIKGEYRPLNLFRFFDDGIRKRLPKMVAKEFYDFLIGNIETNRYGFELSKFWLEYKERIGADKRPFIMFDRYKKAISIITNDGHLTVGFKKTAIHPRAKVSMGKLAIRLEFGDLGSGQPARPLWRNTSRDFFRERRGRLEEMVKNSIDEGKKA